jgi:hypothetical protein
LFPIESAANPFQIFLVLLVIRIGYRLKKIHVAIDTATILAQAVGSIGSLQETRILQFF